VRKQDHIAYLVDIVVVCQITPLANHHYLKRAATIAVSKLLEPPMVFFDQRLSIAWNPLIMESTDFSIIKFWEKGKVVVTIGELTIAPQVV